MRDLPLHSPIPTCRIPATYHKGKIRNRESNCRRPLRIVSFPLVRARRVPSGQKNSRQDGFGCGHKWPQVAVSDSNGPPLSSHSDIKSYSLACEHIVNPIDFEVAILSKYMNPHVNLKSLEIAMKFNAVLYTTGHGFFLQNTSFRSRSPSCPCILPKNVFSNFHQYQYLISVLSIPCWSGV